jgi:hypothetical protein
MAFALLRTKANFYWAKENYLIAAKLGDVNAMKWARPVA